MNRNRKLDDMPDLLTIDQLADYLELPKSTLYQWRSRQRGPRSLTVGRRIRYRKTDVIKWLEEQET